ncbi:hypothetical protein LTS18_000778, partial [Coniosporium uncinatum]
ILLAISSSPLAWTGTGNPFALVGYSLGGGICADFTSFFPNLISSLILIAPSGIVRPEHLSERSRLLYHTPWVPPSLVNWLVKRRLRMGPNAVATTRLSVPPSTDVADAASAEAGEQPPVDYDYAPIYENRPLVSVANAVNWQLEHHDGFVPSFISSIQHSPITHQHHRWRLIGERLSAQKANSADEERLAQGLERSKVLILLGRNDPIVIAYEVEEDAKAVLGTENLEVVRFDAGHEIPISRAEEVVDTMWEFWGETP